MAKPKKRIQKRRIEHCYSITDILVASTTQPLPIEFRTHQLSKMWDGLANIETGEHPCPEDWRVCSDAVNLLETLIKEGGAGEAEDGTVTRGWWRDCAGNLVQVTDASGLLMDAITALATAGRRYLETGKMRLDGQGIQSVRAVLEDYAAMLDALPAKVMMQAHRLTEQRIRLILKGKGMPHDVEIIDVKT